MKFPLIFLFCLALRAEVIPGTVNVPGSFVPIATNGTSSAESIGRILLVIQRDIPIESAAHFDKWQSQVESEGHKVTRLYGPKQNAKETNQAVNFAKSQVWPWVKQNPGSYVFFVGDLPMPRTGYGINPDGHTGSAGAYAATSFYAAPDELWTDVRDNSGLKPRAALLNLPGDGKMDNGTLLHPVKAKVGWFNPFYNPKTFGITNSNQSEYVVDVLRRYFDLNVRFRRGELKAERIGVGEEKGKFNAGVVAWAIQQVGASNVITFDRTESYFVRLPFLIDRDFKGFTDSASFWGRMATGAMFSGLDLTFGSYQVDYGTPRTSFPMNCGALAVGNMGGAWNLTDWQAKTLGELWEQTVTQYGMIYVNLYGDPTLRLVPFKR